MYFGDFTCVEDVICQFAIDASELEGAKILAATYETGNYEGSAMVVFRKDGKLWEINGSHCSCNGLEACWSPEETSYEALMHRFEYGTVKDHLGEEGYDFARALVKGLVDEMFDREVLENI